MKKRLFTLFLALLLLLSLVACKDKTAADAPAPKSENVAPDGEAFVFPENETDFGILRTPGSQENAYTYKTFFLPDTKDQFDFTKWDYVVDAVDTVTAKLLIIEESKKAGVPVISCMGCGNRMDPSKLEITDVYKTVKDPLSKVMRRELKKRGIKKCTVLYSTETALSPIDDPEISCREHCVCPPNSPRSCNDRRAIPASTPFVPPAAGIMIASKVATDIIGFDHEAREKQDLETKLKKRELFRAGRALREKLEKA